MADTKARSPSLADEKAAIGAAKAAARPQLHSESSHPNMNGPLYMQTFGSGRILVRRLKRKEEGTWKQVARWFVENQIGTFVQHCAEVLLVRTLPTWRL
jgi:acyl-CoA-dependent ceramide synthase